MRGRASTPTAIGRIVEAPIAEMILKAELRRGDVAMVEVEDGSIVVDAVTPESSATSPICGPR